MAACRARLLADGAPIVPAAASVFCQLAQIQLCDTMGGISLQPLNKYRQAEGYFGMDLGSDSSNALGAAVWLPLSEPQPVFDFDFAGGSFDGLLEAGIRRLDFSATANGVCNAVVFWFSLQLDEQCSLTNSPHGTLISGAGNSFKATSWQQAVQWLPQTQLAVGQAVALTAQHDTYEISFKLNHPDRDAPNDCNSMQDADWAARLGELRKVERELMRAAASDPLAYRRLASAALKLGTRPQDHGVDAEAAAALCARLMS